MNGTYGYDKTLCKKKIQEKSGAWYNAYMKILTNDLLDLLPSIGRKEQSE